MGVLEDDGPRLAALSPGIVLRGAYQAEGGDHFGLSAVVADGEGHVDVVLNQAGLVEDAVLDPKFGFVVAI